MKILVDTTSIERTGSGTVVGKIYLDVHEAFFPERGWFDFPVVILQWWLEALARLSSGASRREELRFMDGPFWVEIEVGSDVVSYRLVGLADEPVGTLSLEAFRREALAAGRQLVEACDASGWSSVDIDRLQAELR